MAMPVKPSDFDAVIPQTGDSLARKILLLIPLSILLYKIHRYKWTIGGEITPEFAADLCAANCTGTTTTTP